MIITVTTLTSYHILDVSRNILLKEFFDYIKANINEFKYCFIGKIELEFNGKKHSRCLDNCNYTLNDLGITNNCIIKANSLCCSGIKEKLVCFEKETIQEPKTILTPMENILKSRNKAIYSCLKSSENKTFKKSVTFDLSKNEKNYITKEYFEFNKYIDNSKGLFDFEDEHVLDEKTKRDKIEASKLMSVEYFSKKQIHMHMLYCNIKINNVDMIAFVDSGAQQSVISLDVTRKCKLLSILDDKCTAKAKGVVGVQKTSGAIHFANLEINKKDYKSSFVVLDSDNVDVIIGLDFLRRNDCLIDLSNNKLCFGDGNIIQFFNAENASKVKKFFQTNVKCS